MKRRCLDPKHLNYGYYGGRGIKICKRWLDFSLYIKDVGLPPTAEHQLDRIDNNGNYEPKNIKWSMRSENLKNRNFSDYNIEHQHKIVLLDYAVFALLKKKCDGLNIFLKEFIHKAIEEAKPDMVKSIRFKPSKQSRKAVAINSEYHQKAKIKAFETGMYLSEWLDCLVSIST